MTSAAAPVGPLAGVRVLELGQLVAGPYAGSVLADLGATVVKVEPPGQGDVLRAMQSSDVPWFWMVEARNKRCVTLDLRRPEGQALLLALVASVDVLLENFRPGTLDRWNLGEEVLRRANKDLVIARVSGHGQDGPYRDRPATDRQALALSGVLYVSGFATGPPVKPGVAVSDFVAGLHAAVAILAALHHRQATGTPGQTVDVSLYEGMFRMTADLLQSYRATGVVRERNGNRNPAVPGGAFCAADGVWLMIAASTDRLWRNLTQAMDRPDLAADRRLVENIGRQRHVEEVEGAVATWVGDADADAVETALVAHDIPVCRLYTAPEILDDDHYRARGSYVEVPTPYGTMAMPGVVPRFSRTPGAVRHAGPDLGADNEAVYAELLGLDAAALAALADRGII